MKKGRQGMAVTVFIILGALLLAAGIVIMVAQRGARNPAGILLILFGITLIYIGRRVRRIVCCAPDEPGQDKAEEETTE
jgi:cytochrome c biogenesis protein CcdA